MSTAVSINKVNLNIVRGCVIPPRTDAEHTIEQHAAFNLCKYIKSELLIAGEPCWLYPEYADADIREWARRNRINYSELMVGVVNEWDKILLPNDRGIEYAVGTAKMNTERITVSAFDTERQNMDAAFILCLINELLKVGQDETLLPLSAVYKELRADCRYIMWFLHEMEGHGLLKIQKYGPVTKHRRYSVGEVGRGILEKGNIA